MKILIICHEFPPVGAGAANAAFYLAGHMAKGNNSVTVLTSAFKRVSRPNMGFEVIALPVLRRHRDRTSPAELLSFALSGFLYGLLYVRKKKYDVCLAIHGIPAGWVAFFLYKLFGIPYIVSLRGADVPGFLPEKFSNLHKMSAGLTRLYWKNSKAIISNSSGLRDLALKSRDALGNKEIGVIPNGIDCDFYKPDISLRQAAHIKMLYAGRITWQKQLDFFISALKDISPATRQKLHLKIIGEGPLKDRLEDIGRRSGLQDMVSFCGWLDKETLLSEYQSARIFVLPSSYEGMSNSLLEAMACGCMVLASDIPANTGIVKDGENGFVFSPNSPGELKAVLDKVLSAKADTIEEMGRKSRQIAQGHSWDLATRRYLSYMNDVPK